MLGRMYENEHCSAARALELVGERWSLLILRDAMFRGFTRYSDFQRSLGVATNILSKRLEAFVAAGILEAVAASPHPEHREYHLTEKGRDLMPVVIALVEWGDKWVWPGPVDFEHASCGGRIKIQLRCTACEKSPELVHVNAKKRETYRPKRG